mmetsp:Transcript_124879/g.197794  ORF Transcript_124879/g.197794 Transcript_124879/m.197794 type:complete len:208 (+) Transcript_124879:601-1224(+)
MASPSARTKALKSVSNSKGRFKIPTTITIKITTIYKHNKLFGYFTIRDVYMVNVSTPKALLFVIVISTLSDDLFVSLLSRWPICSPASPNSASPDIVGSKGGGSSGGMASATSCREGLGGTISKLDAGSTSGSVASIKGPGGKSLKLVSSTALAVETSANVLPTKSEGVSFLIGSCMTCGGGGDHCADELSNRKALQVGQQTFCLNH